MIIKHQTTDYDTFRETTHAWLRLLKITFGHHKDAPASTEDYPMSRIKYDPTLFDLFKQLLAEEGSFDGEIPKCKATRVGYDAGPGWEIITAFRAVVRELSVYDYVTLVKFDDENDALIFKLSKP